MPPKTIPLNKMSVSLSQIDLTVKCPVCHRSYGVSVRSSSFNKNVSCQHVTFYVTIVSRPGVIDVDVNHTGDVSGQTEFTVSINY